MTLASLTMVLLSSGAPILNVDGEGYMRLVRDGRVVYAKSVRLAVVAGKLGSEKGPTFLPSIPFNGNVGELQVSLQGDVSYQGLPIGRLVLASFTGSTPQKEQEFYVAADRPTLSQPGDGLLGVLRLGSDEKPAPVKQQPKIQPKQQIPAPQVMPVANDQRSDDVVVPSPPSQGCGIGFAAKTAVNTPQIKLGQIAKVVGAASMRADLENIILGDTPAIGVERRFDLARIQVKLRAAGIDLTKVRINIPDTVRVMRQGQVATEAEFIEAASAALTEKFGNVGKLFVKQTQPDVMLPMGAKRLVVDQIEVMRQGYRVGISIYVNDERVNRRILALDTDLVVQTVMVGQTVKVLLRSGGATIETSGRVTRAGRPGEPVEVQVEGGTRLTGKVTANGSVEVTA